MSEQVDIKRLIIEHRRRLQRLKENQARYGINAPPEILTEIEDIEQEIERLTMALDRDVSPETPPEVAGRGYDIAAIRRLLRASFSDEEFTILCYDHFPTVYIMFSGGMTFSSKVQRLLEYCEKRDEFDRLLKLLSRERPHMYAEMRGFPKTSSSILAKVPSESKPVLVEQPTIKWWWIQIIVALIGFISMIFFAASYGVISISISEVGDFLTSPTILSVGIVAIILGIAFVLRQPIIIGARQTGTFFIASVEIVRNYVQSVQKNRARKFENKLLDWKLYVDEELSNHNHVYLHKLKRIPRSRRQKVVDLYLEDNPYVLYDHKHKCLMHQSWPKLKKIRLAWEDLIRHLQSDTETFAEKFVAFIETLEEPLGIKLASGRSLVHFEQFASHKIDMGGTFSDLNLQQKETVICATQYPQPTVGQLKELYSFVKDEQGASIALLILFSDSENADQFQQELYRELRHESCDMIVVTCDNIIGWLLAEKPTRDEFRRAIVSNTRLKAISPFVISGPTPEKMFVGREEELQQIRDYIIDKSFAITGGRRVGKTSIAMRLHKGFLPHTQFYTIYQDVSPIVDHASFLATPIMNWRPDISRLPQTFGDLFSSLPLDRKVVLMLDEADKLIRVDSVESNWPIFSQLRALVNSGHIRIIFLGERALRKIMLNSQSPFFNYADELSIGRLTFENVEILITRPLKKMEIFYEPAIVKRIYEFTSGHPNVVQRLCYRLVEIVDKRNDRRLWLRDVDTVINDPSFQKEDFFGTYFSHATLLERIIIIVIAQADQVPFSGIEIHTLITQNLGLSINQGDVNEALDRLVKLRSILIYSEGYTFAVNAIPELLSRSKTTVADDWLAEWIEKYQKYGDITLEDIAKLEEK